jgi:4-diphosphocytidyl-2-C-methyl-D-erythritol kinase
MHKRLSERAGAKINLFLRVTGQRSDGYHELDSVFLPISLADEIKLEIRDASATSIALYCNLPALIGGNDLATRAARAFLEEFAITAEVRIELTKHIPIGAGLGGGSSDAGTVLRMLAGAMEIGDDAASRIGRIALALGADVPFFLDPRPSRVRGIGELLTPLAGVPSWPIVIAVPPFEVATVRIFRALNPAGWSGPAPDADLAAILRGDISPAMTMNDLAAVATAQFPEIARIKALLEELGARTSQMSGSGGAVFGIFGSVPEAEKAAIETRLRMPNATVVTASTVDS